MNFRQNSILGTSERIKREPGLLLPAPFSSTAKPLHKSHYLMMISVLGAATIAYKIAWTWRSPGIVTRGLRWGSAVRVSKGHASRDRYRRHHEERYHEKSKYALHSFSPPLRFSSSEQFQRAVSFSSQGWHHYLEAHYLA
jgi:hypothetical protein